MFVKYDLHCHSNYSDGQHPPETLIRLAKEAGLTGLSITDHDNVDAYSDALFAFAKEHEMGLITGVEFSTYYEGEGVHLLGYAFDYKHEKLQKFCAAHKERRKKRNHEILALLRKRGMIIEDEELERFAVNSAGRPHIAALLIAKGYITTMQEAFQQLIGDGKPCFYQGEYFTLQQTIEIIHRAGGKAVVAHPILIKKKRILKKLVLTAIDGLECHYARFSREQNQPMIDLAKGRELICTGGSDFHGEIIKPYAILGSSYTDEENLGRLCSSA